MMDSWSETKSLLVVLVVIIIFYVLGRWVAEVWQGFPASGGVPST